MADSNWTWVVRYIVVLVVALILGAVLGQLDLFAHTRLGTPKLTAAKLAQFMGYGGALAMFLLLAVRATRELRAQGDWARVASFIVLPFSALLGVLATHQILLLMFGSLMGPGLRQIYNWIFILATTASAVWFAVALYQHAETMVSLLRSRARRR